MARRGWLAGHKDAQDRFCDPLCLRLSQDFSYDDRPTIAILAEEVVAAIKR